MKKLLFLLSLILFSLSAQAGTITKGVKEKTAVPDIGNRRVISPDDVATAQEAYQRQIQYILDNYSDAELRSYAQMVNSAEIKAAKLRGDPAPAALSYDTLHNRAKIGRYLMSLQKFRY